MHPDIETLNDYIANNLSSKDELEIQEHLKSCQDCFNNYMSIKEINFFEAHAQNADEKLKSKIMNIVSRKQIPLARILIKFLKDQVFVSSAGQESLDFQAIKYDFVFRSGSMSGPIIVSRIIKEYKVELILTPVDSKILTLAVNVDKKDNLSVDLSLNNDLMESVLDIDKQSIFDSEIPRSGNLELLFKKNGKEIFIINMELEGG